jgi:hypothetical protein
MLCKEIGYKNVPAKVYTQKPHILYVFVPNLGTFVPELGTKNRRIVTFFYKGNPYFCFHERMSTKNYSNQPPL